MIRGIKTLACVIALSLISAAPARATPPTSISVEDQAFGISDKELFLMRTTQDNLGSHFERRSEIFLIAVNLLDGSETVWHADSVQVTTVFGEKGEDDRRIVVREGRAGLVNPFAIMAERGGVHWGTVISSRNMPDIVFEVTGDAVTVTSAREEHFTISKAVSAERIRASLRALPQRIPNYARMESITTREQFSAVAFQTDTCRYTDGGRGFSPWTYKTLQLVRVTCSDDEETSGVSFVMVAEHQGPAK